MFAAAPAGESWLIGCIRSYLNDQSETEKRILDHYFRNVIHLSYRDIYFPAEQTGLKEKYAEIF